MGITISQYKYTLLIMFAWLMVFLLGTVYAVYGSTILSLKGGHVPQAFDSKVDSYYTQSDEYKDSIRYQGQTKGFLKQSFFKKKKSKDLFAQWCLNRIENGIDKSAIGQRFKPFYAVDFGRKGQLNGSNPVIVIVNNPFQLNDANELQLAGMKSKKALDKESFFNSLNSDKSINRPNKKNNVPDLNIEIREIWQPWLKYRCDFVVRYIVPSRVGILNAMGSKGQFISAVVKEQKSNAKGQLKNIARPKLFIRPYRLWDKLLGKKTTEITLPVEITSKWLE